MLARRRVSCRAWELGGLLDWAVDLTRVRRAALPNNPVLAARFRYLTTRGGGHRAGQQRAAALLGPSRAGGPVGVRLDVPPLPVHLQDRVVDRPIVAVSRGRPVGAGSQQRQRLGLSQPGDDRPGELFIP